MGKSLKRDIEVFVGLLNSGQEVQEFWTESLRIADRKLKNSGLFSGISDHSDYCLGKMSVSKCILKHKKINNTFK